MIIIYKCVRGLEKVDKKDYIVKDKGRTRGHRYKLRKGRCKGDVRKYSFPYRSIDQWNKLGDEVVCAKNIHIFKDKLDKYNSGSGTIRA